MGRGSGVRRRSAPSPLPARVGSSPRGQRRAPGHAALLWGLAIGATSASPAVAWADDGERAVFVEGGPAVARADGEAEATVGATGGVSAWVGLRPNVWAFLAVGGGSTGAQALGEAYGGVALTVDVLRWVPVLELGLGADLVGGRLAPNARLGLGVDVFVSSRLTIGGAVRLRPGLDGAGTLVSTALRVGWRWD
jgi:hypothetical protein